MRFNIKVSIWLAFIAALVFLYGFPLTNGYTDAMKVGLWHCIKVWYMGALFIFAFSLVWTFISISAYDLFDKVFDA